MSKSIFCLPKMDVESKFLADFIASATSDKLVNPNATFQLLEANIDLDIKIYIDYPVPQIARVAQEKAVYKPPVVIATDVAYKDLTWNDIDVIEGKGHNLGAIDISRISGTGSQGGRKQIYYDLDVLKQYLGLLGRKKLINKRLAAEALYAIMIVYCEFKKLYPNRPSTAKCPAENQENIAK